MLIAALFILGSFLAPHPAWAQVSSGGEMTLYGGIISATGGTQVSDSRGNYLITTEIEDDGTGFGFLGGYNFNRIAGFEGGLVLATNNHKATLVDARPGIGGGENETNLLLFLFGNAVVHLPVPGRVVPYVSSGIGMLGTVGPATNLAFDYGVGVKVYLSRRVAIRLAVNRLGSNLKDSIGQAVFTGRSQDRCDEFDLDQFVCFDTPFTDRLRFTELIVGLTLR
jgi:hypothetical protein